MKCKATVQMKKKNCTWVVMEDDVQEVLVSPCDVVLVLMIEWV